jgi:hypothetical protein
VRRSDLPIPCGVFAKSREGFASSEAIAVSDADPADSRAAAFADANTATASGSARERSTGVHPELGHVRFARDGMDTRRRSVQ